MSIYKKVPVRTLQVVAELIDRLLGHKVEAPSPIESYDELKRRLNRAAMGKIVDQDLVVIKRSLKLYPQTWPYLKTWSRELLTEEYGFQPPTHRKKKKKDEMTLSSAEQKKIKDLARVTRQETQHKVETEVEYHQRIGWLEQIDEGR